MISAEPASQPWGVWQATIADPDGNSLVVVKPAEA